ncbi:MAG: agmatinase [Vicinamibacterales bacterium]
MAHEPRYPTTYAHQFGGAVHDHYAFDTATAVVLPVPLDRTTSYVPGTMHGPREILAASAQVELWDEETGLDAHARGLYTLPEMDLSHGEMADVMAAIERVAGEVLDADKFLVTLGGEHSITPALVAAAARRHPGLTVLQIDAHADLRAHYQGEPLSHACAMRRSLEHAPVVQVGIRNISEEEVRDLPGLRTTIFYDWNMRDDPDWIARVVQALDGPVYVTIDLDGLEPGLMPAVGTPEPGGLSWREITTLLRRVFEARSVVACDVVELCPLPGMVAPNFAAARLVYKLLAYRAAATDRARRA